MTAVTPPSLNSVPQEVLEHIAFFATTDSFLGPPSAIIPLLTTSRRCNSFLSIASNHFLYARIFAYKFDLAPVYRRFGSQCVTPAILSAELQRRCFYLKRIRLRLDSAIMPFPVATYKEETLHAILWMAYLMMLENDGKNEEQLRNFARIDDWLREYWFSDNGASLAQLTIKKDQWPSNNETASLAMWLFWFLLRPDDYLRENYLRSALGVLKILALGAHKYSLTSPSWIDFIPRSRPGTGTKVNCYSESRALSPPPLATPAILSYVALVSKLLRSGDSEIEYPPPLEPSLISSPPSDSQEWECEWGRCLSLGQAEFDNILTDSYRPGSIDGIWEGMFTYTEFMAYAAVLSGSPPSTLQRGVVARHRQTWKLREHHLLGPDPAQSDSGIEVDSDNVDPLSPGEPLRSYFPAGTIIKEYSQGLQVLEAGSENWLHYRRALPADISPNGDGSGASCVQDVIVTGEGHSAWGQFNMIGRVRPCDGFISLSKEYVNGDRGKWLYRGYLVGNTHGNLAGRWRDTLNRPEIAGYEGCFTMTRRRERGGSS